jgi:hypothetical protein
MQPSKISSAGATISAEIACAVVEFDRFKARFSSADGVA